MSTLSYLKKKTSCFLIEYFSSIYKNLNCSQPIFNNKYKLTKYKLCTLNKTVDIKLLPSGYHTAHVPKADECDHCNNKFDPNLPEYNGDVLVCGHSYHYDCFETLEKSCGHCTEFYKKGIFDNVNSYLKRLEKGEDILMVDELENERENNNENDESSNDQESIEI